MRARTACLWALVLLGLALQALGTPSCATAETSDLSVSPTTLDIRESFRGAPVAISAEIPQGASAVLEVRGVAHEDHLLRQGRRGGLWMSVGEVTVHGAPSVYYLLSTLDLHSHSDIASRWGYNALQKQTEFQGAIPREGSGELFEQLVKLKENEGLYGVFPKSLKLTGTSKDKSTLEGQLTFPSNIPPGNYRIVLSVLNSGKLLEQKSFELTVEMSGLPGLLASLANEHAALYGLIAVVIAIVTGFVTGFLFKSKGAH
ncbi:MAG: TIGR02186 family protein [Desulfomonile tiedjei]|uniref:TIGR02186 family protein n=1 Tax=Desulfomonile tiedjei TaxID=2358 RepID=A0A9D6V3Q7_9BACT|nr:TIGR02186 family protein [Desulfomonile tiedjei]